MEVAAQNFEQDDRMLKEVSAHMLLGDDSLQSTLFACTKDDGYRPYCKIESEAGTANQKVVKGNLEFPDPISQKEYPRSTTQEFMSSAGFSLSSLPSDERLIQNVWFLMYVHLFIFDFKQLI